MASRSPKRQKLLETHCPKANRLVSTIANDDELVLATIASLEELQNGHISRHMSTATITNKVQESRRNKIVIVDGNRSFDVRYRPNRLKSSERSFLRPEDPEPLMDIGARYKAIQGAIYEGQFVSSTLGRDVQLQNGDYLRVKHVLCSVKQDSILLCGNLFRKLDSDPISSMIHRQPGTADVEVCQICHYPASTSSSICDADNILHEFFTVKLERIHRHCKIVLTNMTGPERVRARFERGAGNAQPVWPTVFCRYRYNSAAPAELLRETQGSIIQVPEADTDIDWRLSDDDKRTRWRGITCLGGSTQGMRSAEVRSIQKEWRLNEQARQQFPMDVEPYYDTWSTEDSRIPPQVLSGLSADSPITVDDDGGGGDDSSSSPRAGSRARPCEITDDDMFSDNEASMPILPMPQLQRAGTTDKMWSSCLREEKEDTKRWAQTLRRYSCGDGFCGGGGTGRGMIEAGLHVDLSFDLATEMCSAYRKMNPATMVANTDAYGFISIAAYHRIVDILHLSPPCQYFSPAHTHVGQNDEANTAAQFMISGMLTATKPRIATVEQTAGIVSRHSLWFWALIEQFTSLGFSVRWKIVNMANYGVPQERMRLIIIASCPGEKLPSFPIPYHAKNPGSSGKRLFHTINDAIRGIPEGWHDHNPLPAHQRSLANFRTFDGDRELAKTISCGGGQGNNHPSGQRGYTTREFASLQTFPLHHLFPDNLNMTMLKKQIGNAVPPLFAKRLFSSIVEQLKIMDEVA